MDEQKMALASLQIPSAHHPAALGQMGHAHLAPYPFGAGHDSFAGLGSVPGAFTMASMMQGGQSLDRSMYQVSIKIWR